MKWIPFVLMVLVPAALPADDRLSRVYVSYQRGDILGAEMEFRQLPKGGPDDGNYLFLSALFESRGSNVRDWLEAAVRTGIDDQHGEAATFRLLQVLEAQGDAAGVLRQGEKFLQERRKSPFREQVLAMLTAHSTGDASDQYVALLLQECPDTYHGQFARLVRAEREYRRGKVKEATVLCRQVTAAADNNLSPVGLILLARMALESGEAERALLQYDLLREESPQAIGQEDLTEALGRLSEQKSAQESIEKLKDIAYSVQVGVFAQKDNARKMAEQFKSYGYPVVIVPRLISDKAYQVVLVGRFAVEKEAQAARRKLERGENQVFKVVVSDDR